MAGFGTAPTLFRDRQNFLLAATTANQAAVQIDMAQFFAGASGGVTKARFRITILSATMSFTGDPEGEYTVLIRRQDNGNFVTYGSTGTNPVTWAMSTNTLQILIDGGASQLGLIIFVEGYLGEYDYT